MRLNITFLVTLPNSRTVKLWGTDPIDTYSTSVRLVYDPASGTYVRKGQFSHRVPLIEDANGKWLGTWSANDLFVTVTNAQLQQIASIQVADENTVDEKISWLTWYGQDTWGAPMRASYSPGANWQAAANIRLIGAVWAGQPVILTGERKTVNVTFDGKPQSIAVSRIQTFTDWASLSRDNPLVVQCTAVDAADRPIKPHGTIYLPLYFGNRRAWVFDRHLKEG